MSKLPKSMSQYSEPIFSAKKAEVMKHAECTQYTVLKLFIAAIF